MALTKVKEKFQIHVFQEFFHSELLQWYPLILNHQAVESSHRQNYIHMYVYLVYVSSLGLSYFVTMAVPDDRVATEDVCEADAD